MTTLQTTIDPATGGVQVTFSAPYDNAEVITAYKVEFNYNPWEEVTQYCSGTTTAILQSLSCLVPMSALRAAPFNLAYNAPIRVRIQA